jgi:aminopeptidase N
VVVAHAEGRPTPRWILPVGGGLGYAYFALDPETLRYLTHSLHRIRDPLTRGAALVALWEAMLAGDVAVPVVQSALLTALPLEPDELNLERMLDNASTAFWRFTAAADRAALAARMEPVLRSGVARARSTSARAAWFNTLRTVAILPESLAWLEEVWRRERVVPGLPLSETDEADLALDLAVRDRPGTTAMLAAQLGRMDNPDRRARFAYLMPAISADEAVRDQFFDSLRQPAERARESWVIDAVRYLNHPLRTGSSQRYVRPALELLHEIQRTGDIFFPKRWIDAALSGHQTAGTAAEVQSFISALPRDYPSRLRWVLLSAADPLFRASRAIADPSDRTPIGLAGPAGPTTSGTGADRPRLGGGG